VQSGPTAIGTSAMAQAPGNAVPEEVLSRWTWGPFFLWLLWPFWNADTTHKIIAIAIFVCNFVPVIHFLTLPASLVFAIYLGLKGNRIMAANRHFSSLADFQAVQSAWAKWGLIVFVVTILLGFLLFVLFGAIMMAIFAGAAMAGSHAR
jgi:hypothetical protein